MFNTRSIIGNLDKQRPSVIWGAGISGLLLGFYLKKNGYKVTLKEANHSSGGKIATSYFDSHVIEHGANALFLNHEAYELIKDLNLLDEVLIPSNKLKRKIFHSGKFHSIFSQIPLLRLVKNLGRSTPHFHESLTIKDFFEPWLGIKSIEQLLNPALGGIYATTSDQIQFLALFDFNEMNYPKTYWKFIQAVKNQRKNLPRSPIKGSVGFRGGMVKFIGALENYLKNDIIYGVKDTPNFTDHNNIICTDASAAKTLLQNYPDIVEYLDEVDYGPISSNTLLLKKPLLALEESFGVVFGVKVDRTAYNLLGVLANQNIFNANYPKYHSYTIISRQLHKTQNDLIEDLRVIDKNIVQDDIVVSESFNWKTGLPRYNYKRYLAIKKLHQHLDGQKGICIFGNYVAGISMREMILAAKNFVLHLNRSTT